MKCLRCDGLMDLEPVNAEGSKVSIGWCCVRCREIVDGVVLPNRTDRWARSPVVKRSEERRHG